MEGPSMRKGTSGVRGWVVEVATLVDSGSPPKFGYFNVAIADEGKAVGATRKRLGGMAAFRIEAVRGLTDGEIGAIGLKTGEVAPA
jgi:hypothetical protein